MNIEEIIKNRRTVSHYSTEVVPLEIIKKSIELAILAPNHRCTFPWKFFHVGREFRSELAEVQVAMKAARAAQPMSEAVKSSMRKKFIEEGELIIAGITKNADPAVEREDYASLAMALQNMSLYLWSEGYGSKWGSGAIIQHPLVYKALSESAEKFTVCAFFWVGRPAGPVKSVPRPPVETFFKEI